MIDTPPSIHPDYVLTGEWQKRVVELLAQASALIPDEAHWRCRADLDGVMSFWMFVPREELAAQVRGRNRARKSETLTMDLT